MIFINPALFLYKICWSIVSFKQIYLATTPKYVV